MVNRYFDWPKIGIGSEVIDRAMKSYGVQAIEVLGACTSAANDPELRLAYRGVLARNLASADFGGDQSALEGAARLIKEHYHAPLDALFQKRQELVSDRKVTKAKIIEVSEARNNAEINASHIKRVAEEINDSDEFHIIKDSIRNLEQGNPSAGSTGIVGLEASTAGLADKARRGEGREKIDAQKKLKSVQGEISDLQARVAELENRKIKLTKAESVTLTYKEALDLCNQAKAKERFIQEKASEQRDLEDALAEIVQRVELTDKSIARETDLFTLAVTSPATKTINPEEFKFGRINDRELLGAAFSYQVVCQQASELKDISEVRALLGSFDRELRDALQAALADPSATSDVEEALASLARTARSGVPIFYEMAEKPAASGPLVDLLYRQVRDELRDGLGRSLTERPIAWNEDFHGYLIDLYSAHLVIKHPCLQADPNLRRLCSGLVGRALVEWDRIENERAVIAREDASLDEGERRTLPQSGITLLQMTEVASDHLRYTNGTPRVKAEREEQVRNAIHSIIKRHEVNLVGVSDDELGVVIRPFSESLRRIANVDRSTLLPILEEVKEFYNLVTEEILKRYKIRQEALRNSEVAVEDAVETQGLDFDTVGNALGQFPRLASDRMVVPFQLAAN